MGQPGSFAEKMKSVTSRRLGTLLALVICALSGCSTGGFVPGGPHTLPSGALDGLVRNASDAYHVDARLVASVIDSESRGDPSAISRAGARGLMQLMPDTAAQYGVANPFDPAQNIDGGTRYLRDLLHRYRGNVRLAVAAYNAGPGAVDAAGGVPAFAETRAYVDRVTAALR